MYVYIVFMDMYIDILCVYIMVMYIHNTVFHGSFIQSFGWMPFVLNNIILFKDYSNVDSKMFVTY